ncbi:MAG: hypothetical protein CMJ18_22275 [Phycisphaeraceae bacterium]|nr:hypothetical protein [Phycisphaeraceae bacterium]
MSNETFHGIMPAIASPCDEDDRFHAEAFESLARHLYEQGVDGLYVCGATGDAYNLHPEERRRILELAIDISRPFTGRVIAHVGAADMRTAVELAEHAGSVGADAVASMPPAHHTLEQLLVYYDGLAKAARRPTLVYHIPRLTGLSLSPEAFRQLMAIDGVVGLKCSGSDLFLLRRLLLACPGAAVINGDDELLTPALMYGACGGIGMTYNLFAKFFVRLYETVKDGRIDDAFKMQHRFVAFLDRAIELGGIKPVFEHMMAIRGFGPYVFRRPRINLDERIRAEFSDRMGPYLRGLD